MVNRVVVGILSRCKTGINDCVESGLLIKRCVHKKRMVDRYIKASTDHLRNVDTALHTINENRSLKNELKLFKPLRLGHVLNLIYVPNIAWWKNVTRWVHK